MNKLHIAFADFWPDFITNNNFITQSLDRSRITYILDNINPQVLFYSCFGKKHLKYNNCSKILYLGENIRPNFLACDYSISFDFKHYRNRNLRWPLYNLSCSIQDLTRLPVIHTQHERKFCCMVTSNNRKSLRLQFYKALCRYKKIDSGGRVFNNQGGAVPDKHSFITNYKFCFAIENSYYPGYTTEKIVQAKNAGCIPIYWGNPKIELDFDTNSFVNMHQFHTFKECIDYIEYLDTNHAAYAAMSMKPLLQKLTKYSDYEVLDTWLARKLAKPEKSSHYYILEKCIDKLQALKTFVANKLGSARIRSC